MTPARGLALAIVAAAVQPASAGPCAPRAHLDGDADAVTKVTTELQALGIVVDAETAPRGDRCPVVVAAVELDRGGGIAVAVRDATNRSEGRVLSDPALAAAWIDSWIHDDFAPELPASAPPEPVAAPGTVSPRADVAPVAAAPTLLDRIGVEAGYVRAFAFDGSTGSGFAGGACVEVGGLCLGARLASSQLDLPAGIARADLSVTATASWSYTLGRMAIAPEVGVGVGRMTTDACPPPPPCDPTMMMCPALPSCDAVGVHQTSYTPRLAATLRASVPLFEHVWLDGTASFVLAPLGHGDPFPGSTDPAGNMPGAVPGEPEASAQLGVGVRVGLP